MRILSNYGYKSNGESYSVTFETITDLNNEKPDTVVDSLFAQAKAAIQRQVNGNTTITRPNGNASKPLTGKQRKLIIYLAKEKGKYIGNLDFLTSKSASEVIKCLMGVA